MLISLIIAIIAGNTSTYCATVWIATHTVLWENIGLAFPNGIPSYDTYARMLRMLDHEALAMEFVNWMNQILLPVGIHMAIDGKGLVGATERIKGKRIPYVLNIVETHTGLTIAAIPIQEKSNEIRAIPQILAWVAICSNIFTIDAIGTQTEIIQLILQEHGDFLLLVKRNNPDAYDRLISYFTSCRKEQAENAQNSKENPKQQNASAPSGHCKQQSGRKHFSQCECQPDPNLSITEWKFEKNRDRIEYRRCIVMNISSEHNNEHMADVILGATSSLGQMPLGTFKTIGMYEAVRIPLEQDEYGNDITPSLTEFLEHGSKKRPHPKTGDEEDCDIYRIGIVSHAELTAEQAMNIKRHHWSVENKLHHVLDASMREDYSSSKAAKWNLSLLRKLSLNLIRLAMIYQDIKDMNSIPAEGLLLASDPELLRKLVFGNLPLIKLEAWNQ